MWMHIFGLDNGSGAWYLFWSGIGSDIGELAIIGGLIGVIRKYNCHVHRCPRLGRHHVVGTSWVVCAHHHPTGAPTSDQIAEKG